MSSNLSVLLISPHADDIALSIGGWLAFVRRHQPELLHRMSVYTAFSWSSATPRMNTEPDNSRKITFIREKEEKAFCSTYGLPLELGMLPDTSILKIDHLEPIDINKDQRLALLKELLAPMVEGQVVFAPVSIGEHIDHRIAFQAISELSHLARLVVYYEDLPYATFFSSEQRDEILQSKLGKGSCAYTVMLDGELRDEKRRSLKLYPSQMNAKEVEAALNYRPIDSNGSLEQVWVLSPNEADHKVMNELGYRPEYCAQKDFLQASPEVLNQE